MLFETMLTAVILVVSVIVQFSAINMFLRYMSSGYSKHFVVVCTYLIVITATVFSVYYSIGGIMGKY